MGTIVKITGNLILKTNSYYDYTLFTVNNIDSVRKFGHYGLMTTNPSVGSDLFIP